MAGREVRAGKAFVEIALRDRLEAGLKRISARLRGFAAGVGAIGRPLLALGAGLGAPLALATGVFAGFDDQMRLVKAVTQATDDEFARLRATAQELGRTTSFTSAQVAGLMTELGRAGFNPDQIDRMTASVLDLAKATGTDATLASGIMAASIRQFSLDAGDAGRVADALTVAANKSFNTLESLGEALTYAGPVASDFNMSIEDTLALLGALGNVGIQGSNAGTALRRLLTLSGAEAEKLKEIFGVSFVDMRGNARPLVDVLDEVNQATKDLGTAARAQKFNEAFGLLGITGASALSKNAVNVRELRDALANANGVAARTHKEMESGLGGTFRRILSAAEGVAIAIGDALAPALQALEPIVTTVLGSITKWIGEHKTLVTVVAASVAAIAGVGGVLVAIAGAASLAAFAVSGAATVWSIATGALAAIGTVIGAIVSPVGLLIAGVVAAGAALLYFSGVGGKVIRWLQTRFGELVGFVTKVAGEIGDALMAGDMQRAATILWDAIKVAFARGVEGVSALWESVQASAQQAWAGVRAAAGWVMSWFANAWNSVRSALAALGQTAGAAFQSVAGMVGSAIRTAIQFVQSLPARFVEAVRRIPAIAASVFSTLGGIAQQALSVAVSVVERLPSLMASAIAAVPQLIGTMFRGIAQAVSALAELLPAPLRNFVQAGAGVVSEVGSLFGQLASVVGAVLSPIASVARTVVPCRGECGVAGVFRDQGNRHTGRLCLGWRVSPGSRHYGPRNWWARVDCGPRGLDDLEHLVGHRWNSRADCVATRPRGLDRRQPNRADRFPRGIVVRGSFRKARHGGWRLLQRGCGTGRHDPEQPRVDGLTSWLCDSGSAREATGSTAECVAAGDRNSPRGVERIDVSRHRCGQRNRQRILDRRQRRADGVRKRLAVSGFECVAGRRFLWPGDVGCWTGGCSRR